MTSSQVSGKRQGLVQVVGGGIVGGAFDQAFSAAVADVLGRMR
jgi:hypothetical protein